MAEDGIEDYGLAKRKAARQLGMPDARRLPNNDEIDAALREYQGIYQSDDQHQFDQEHDRENRRQDDPAEVAAECDILSVHLALNEKTRGLVNADRPVFAGVRQVINYGLDKLRFPSAVIVGSRVRAHCVLLKVEPVSGGLQVTEQYTVEIEGQPKPACVAEAIMRLYF